MSYLQENNSANLAARITYKGRKNIAQGHFNISYFQIGDSEYDYGFSEFDGITQPAQKILTPLDKDSQVKYPYKVSDSTVTGTTYGMPILASLTETITNNVGPAGYVSEFVEYDSITPDGTTVICTGVTIDSSALSGSTFLNVPNGNVFQPGNGFITLHFNTLTGINAIIKPATVSGLASTSLVYHLVGITGNTLQVDRDLPDLSLYPGTTFTIMTNDCTFPGIVACNESVVVTEQQDPWNLSIVWSQNPAGLDPNSASIDEKLSGYTSNAYASSKEYFGYNTLSGQTPNDSTTIMNSFGVPIIVPPEEQHCIAIIHYSKASDIMIDPWLTFKYEDYIDHTTDGEEYFEIYIPFLQYERNTGTTIGARFFMDSVDYYINSSAVDTRLNQMKYRYLIDEQGVHVGKIFVNHKIIIIDDQELVATLDPKSNRRYTLPIPAISIIPIDVKCETYNGATEPLLAGTGDTVFVTYVLQYLSGTTLGLDGLACNYYNKISGNTMPNDVTIKFNSNDFKFMKTAEDITNISEGYIADTFKILIQKVDTGEQPVPTQWREIDFTAEIPNHTLGNIIDPTNLRDARFIITYEDYNNASIYSMWDPDSYDTETSPEFGDEQPFTGSVKVRRATDMEVMIYMINLPSNNFITTQNPSYVYGLPKRITEVALLDDNKDVMIIAKASSPIVRTGTQVLSIKIDI